MRLKAFGALALLRDGGAPDEAKIQRRQLAVLAVLAAEGGAGLTRDRLLGLFWPEKEQDRARNLLSQAIFVARRALGADVIVEGATALHVNAELLPSDVADFTRALAKGDLEAAVAAYSGPLLDAVYLAGAPEFERWADGKRAMFAQAFVDALTRLARAATDLRDHARAVGYLRRAAASDPLSGTVTCALMTALAHAGDQNAALDAARVHADLVREELDADPDANVLALVAELRAGRIRALETPAATANSVTPADRAPRTAATEDTRPRQYVTAELAKTGAPSIAVLPFASISAEMSDDFFADGLTEEVINALMRLRAIRVTARTTVFAFKGKSEDVRAIGRRLGVHTVLEGSVRRSGNLLRITAQLINVADGAHLWLGQFDRELGDVFALQDEIAQAIAQTLQLSLLGVGFPPRMSVKTAAYERYLRGRFFRDRRNPTSLRRALACFREAITLEPGYALAYAGEADTFSEIALYGAISPHEAMPRIRVAALRALALDPSLAEPHAALGCVAALYEWDWPVSATEFQRALAINPQYQTGHLWYATYCLAPQSRLEEALTELRGAHRLDPLSLVINTSIGMVLFFAQRYDEAVASFRNVLDLDPHYLLPQYFLGRAEVQRGRFAAAIEALERAVAISNGNPLALSALGHAHARGGDEAEARALLERLETMPAGTYVSPFEAAFVRTGLGDSDGAIRGLEHALDERSPAMIWLGVQPELDALRGDARVQAMLRRMGLPA